MNAKQRAHAAVHAAVASGVLPPAGTLVCAQCGSGAHIYHHHQGYERAHWLDVQPLCRPCHQRHHVSAVTKARWAQHRVEHATDERLSIRFPNAVAVALKELAKEEHRSVNGTVLEAVERYLRARRGRPKDAH